jgi:magnesium chelatase family protein
VAISRVALQVDYPARFQLVAAMNPCPCGYSGDSSGRCRCTPPEIARYRARISGPLLDRIDLRVEVARLSSEELLDDGGADRGMNSEQAARRVSEARRLQLRRSHKLNAELTSEELKANCRLDRAGRQLVAQARERLNLSARATHRILRVARTIADLDEAATLELHHLAEALQLRRLV